MHKTIARLLKLAAAFCYSASFSLLSLNMLGDVVVQAAENEGFHIFKLIGAAS